MKNRKIVLISCAVMFLISFIFVYQLNHSKVKTEYISVSWSYNYGSVEEMTEASDIIALVKIEDLIAEDNSTGGPYSTYSAKVIQAVYNCNEGENINIYMTGGQKGEKIVEVIDDPLFEKNQEFLIFAAKNTNGTYRILSGPQGRMFYQNGKLNSLHNVPETFESFAKARSTLSSKDYSIDIMNQPLQDMVKEIQMYITK